MPGTGYSDDDLRIRSDTDIQEIYDYVDRRTRNPVVVDGVTIFNYSTHTLDEEALHEATEELYRDVYMIPFQLGPVWGVMMSMLPKKVRETEYLMYDSTNGTYNPHTNFQRVTTVDERLKNRKELAEWSSDNTGNDNEWELDEEEHSIERYL